MAIRDLAEVMLESTVVGPISPMLPNSRESVFVHLSRVIVHFEISPAKPL